MITFGLIILRLFNPFKYSLYECHLENGVSGLFTGPKEQIDELSNILTQKHFEHLQQTMPQHPPVDLTKPK